MPSRTPRSAATALADLMNAWRHLDDEQREVVVRLAHRLACDPREQPLDRLIRFSNKREGEK